MASLLDYDFDLDKMLGTTVNPVQGLVNDPNFQTEKNIASGLGVADALISGYGKQYAPEILLRGLINAKSGRQGVIDKQVKGYMTQQDMFTQTLKNRKLNQDIRLNEYAEADAPLKSKKLGYETSEAKNKSILSDTQIDGIQRLIKTLPEHEQYELATVGPKAFYNNRPITQQDRIFYESIGVPNRFQIPEDKVNIIREYNLTMPQEAADRHNALEDSKVFNTTHYKPNYVTGKLDFAKNLINNNGLNKNNNKNLTEEYNNKNTERNKQVTYGWQSNKDGNSIFRSFDNKEFTQEEYDNFGTEEALMYEATDRDDFKMLKRANNEMARDSRKLVQFGIGENRKRSETIEKILNNPKALRALFNTKGRLKVKLNELTSDWFAELGGDAQDVKNFISVLQNKEFTTAITQMRNNNPTGGAVGNVSDKEVAMFKSMAQFLELSGSGGNMYEALKDLYTESGKLQNEYREAYESDFGRKSYNASYIPKQIFKFKTFGPDGDYANTLPEALIRAGLDPITGESAEIDGSLNETERSIEEDLLPKAMEMLKLLKERT